MSESPDRLVAAIPIEFQDQGIHWLVLEHDMEYTGGWFLFYHICLDMPCEYDGWYLTREQAENQALHWGVGKEDWVNTPSPGQRNSTVPNEHGKETK